MSNQKSEMKSVSSTSTPSSSRQPASTSHQSPSTSSSRHQRPPPQPVEPDWSDATEDFDAICNDDDDPSLGDISKRNDSSMIRTILARILAGGSLGSLLPIWVFERRSLLEVYGGFFAHPDDFVAIADHATPEERFLAAVKFYLKSIAGLRKHEIARKPYNPLLGETFRCRWTLPGVAPSPQKTTGGPFPGSSTNQLTYVAEQVSHHPPVSAFYAEYPAKRISYTGTIWTKVAVMTYLPPSIGAYNIGQGALRLHDLNETYLMDFPAAYGRDITSIPWVEFGGKVKIKCKKTDYKAVIYFKNNAGAEKKHRIEGHVFLNNTKIYKLRGEWTGIVTAERIGGGGPTLEWNFQTEAIARPLVKKACDPIQSQGPMESRRVWRHVTAALYRNDFDKATKAKEWLSARQRVEATERSLRKTKWVPKYFKKKDDVDFKYVADLCSRSKP